MVVPFINYQGMSAARVRGPAGCVGGVVSDVVPHLRGLRELVVVCGVGECAVGERGP